MSFRQTTYFDGLICQSDFRQTPSFGLSKSRNFSFRVCFPLGRVRREGKLAHPLILDTLQLDSMSMMMSLGR